MATASVLLPAVSLTAARSISATTSGRLIVTTFGTVPSNHYVSMYIMIEGVTPRDLLPPHRIHAPRPRPGGGEVQEGEAVHDRQLAQIQDREKALGRMR